MLSSQILTGRFRDSRRVEILTPIPMSSPLETTMFQVKQKSGRGGLNEQGEIAKWE